MIPSDDGKMTSKNKHDRFSRSLASKPSFSSNPGEMASAMTEFMMLRWLAPS